jgi:hypothetical protein
MAMPLNVMSTSSASMPGLVWPASAAAVSRAPSAPSRRSRLRAYGSPPAETTARIASLMPILVVM